MGKTTWSMDLGTEGGTIHLSSHETAAGTTRIEKGDDYKRSIHENQNCDRDICVHDHNPDGSEDKTWYDKDGNYIKSEHYD